jgi:hypothetical protein
VRLTVAIPTYKRPELLARCIDSALASIGDHDCEVLVCDDSGDDTNAAVYAARASAGTRLRVVRNSVNLGIDANICHCVEEAMSAYVWLIGEDDLMRQSGVATVLAILSRSTAYPFVYVNYSYITDDQSLELRHQSIEESRTELPFETFVDEHLWSAGFIGGCVVNRDDFLETDYRSYIGTYYAHVAGIILASLGRTIGLVCEPQVGNRVGTASTFTWSSDSFGVFQGWRLLLKRLAPVLGPDHYERARASHQRAHGYLGYKFLMTKKADEVLSAGNVADLVQGDVSDAERHRIHMVAHYFPASFCRAVRAAYAAARRTRLQPFTGAAR